MANISLYKTYTNYSSEQGFNQLAYPVRDAITVINPFFVMLVGVLVAFWAGSYYAFTRLSGKTRIFGSLLASSFSITVISFFFSWAEWITPYHVLTFIGITVLSLILTIFYK